MGWGPVRGSNAPEREEAPGWGTVWAASEALSPKLAWGLGDTWPDPQLSCSSEEGLVGSLLAGSLGCPRTLLSHGPSTTRDTEAWSKEGPRPRPCTSAQGPSAQRQLPAQWRAALRTGCPSERAGGWGYAQPCHTVQNHTASSLLEDPPQTSGVEIRSSRGWETSQPPAPTPPPAASRLQLQL